MIFKKTVGSILVIIMILSSLSISMASEVDFISLAMSIEEPEEVLRNANFSKKSFNEKQIVNIAKLYIRDLFEMEVKENEFDTYFEYRENWNRRGSYIWQVNFYSRDRDDHTNIYVAIDDATGKIISSYFYQYSLVMENQVVKYTYEEAQEIAYNFLKKVNADLLENLTLNSQADIIQYRYPYNRGLQPSEYRFTYTRLKEGIPVVGNYVQIGVNNGSGMVTSYEISWDEEEKFPEIDSIITSEKAQDIFMKDLDFQLLYIPVRSSMVPYEQEILEVKLVYSPQFIHGTMLDAKTGQFIDLRQLKEVEIKKLDVTEQQKQEFEHLKSQREAKEQEMSQEEAVIFAQRILKSIYKKDIKIDNASYSSGRMYSGYRNRRTWDLNFIIGNNTQTRGNITIDALTEEVISIYYHDWLIAETMRNEVKNKDNISEEDAYQQSIEILNLLHPDKLKYIQTEQIYYDDSDVMTINFNFYRIEKGIPYTNNYIHLSFNRATGLLETIYCRWDDVSFPEVGGLIDKEAALKTYLEQSEIKLQYATFHPIGTVLVYVSRLVDENSIYPYIDAKTGDQLDIYGKKVKDKKMTFDTVTQMLDGHWAEKELKIMVQNGIVDLDYFALEDVVTKKEVIKMVVLAGGYWPYSYRENDELKFTDIYEEDEYYQYIAIAAQQGFIDHEAVAFNGNDIITREEMAVMLIKMMGLDTIADSKEIYTLPVKDVDEINPDLLGYVALAYGLEIIKGLEDYYSPKDKLTVVEAAVSIYRAYNVLRKIR